MKNKFATLFFSTLKISACTFGGGFVIVPLLRRKFVEELGWVEEQEMLDMTAIAQSSPGPIAVNASVLVGYKVAGITGALTAALGTTLPPLFIISVISLFYAAFRDNPVVDMVMKSMLSGVAAVICDVVITMAGKVCGNKKWLIPAITMVCAFIAVRFLKVNIILVILVCGILGALQTKRGGETA